MPEIWKSVRHYVAPTKENAFRPHLLGKPWLTFFFVLIMAVEGFLISGLVVRQSDGAFFTSAPGESVAAASAAQSFDSFVQSLGRQILRFFSTPDHSDAILGAIAGLLLLTVAAAFFMHIDVQSHEALAGGMVVAVVALLCIAANLHFLSGISMLASVGAP